MTELTFTKSFLSTLDARPLKLQPDHTSNPKTLELDHAYTLPRMPQPMKKTSSSSTPSAPTICTIALKSSRNPTLSLILPGVDTGTTVLELKEKVAKDARVEVEKVRLLWAKKPVADVKTVKEVVGDDLGEKAEVEFGVMVMGYVASNLRDEVKGDAKAEAGEKEVAGEGNVAQGESGKEVLEKEEFWGDLKGFLVQRIRDEEVAKEVFRAFVQSWKGR